MADRSGTAQRQAEDRADMVLELAGLRAFDGPVPRIVDTRRHFVGNELPASHKELDGQYTRIVEVLQDALQMRLGLLLQSRVAIGRDGVTQDAG